MSLAAILIPPLLDAKQAQRLRRFGVASLSYVLAAALVAIGWLFGTLPASILLEAAAAFVSVNVGLYLVIRSGINLRFEDPSLTRFQILVAITILMYIVYHMSAGRDVALFGCFVVFQFGVFRLRVREFTLVTLYTLAAYALVINLLMYFRPQTIHDVPGEWMSWLGLAGFLPCLNIVGGQINALRQRMRESEARFRSLTEMSSDFYWESDTEQRLTQHGSANKKISAVSVFGRGAQIGDRRWEIPCQSPDEAGWREHRAVLDAHQRFRDFEFSRLAVDGTERYISISGDPMFNASGAFEGYRGVGTDITARKRVEKDLRDSAQQLRLFADNVPVMTVYWDQDLRCRFASRAFAEFHGFSVEDIVGMQLRDIVGEEIFLDGEDYIAQVRRGQPVTYQRRRTLKNHDLRFVEIRLLPDVGDRGEVVGCFSVMIDITEHKRAEEHMQIYPADAQDADTLVKAADAAMYRVKQATEGVSDLARSRGGAHRFGATA